MTTSPMSGETVLVTGGRGFIGSHLCRALDEAGCTVHSVSRSAHTQKGSIRCWKGDLADLGTVRRILSAIRPDLIFHLAGCVSGARDLALVMPALRDNLLSTVNLLTCVAEIGCRRILLAGSLEEPCQNASEPVPCSPYAAAKWAAAGYARTFHALYKVPVVVSRLFMVYGPGQSDRRKLIPYVILSLLKKEAPQLASGRRLVDWVYIEDVVEGLLTMANAPEIEGKTIDVGSGTAVSIREIVERLVRLLAPDIQPVFGALPERPLERVRVANSAEARTLTGWCPHTSLEAGLQETAAWYARQLRSQGCGSEQP